MGTFLSLTITKVTKQRCNFIPDYLNSPHKMFQRPNGDKLVLISPYALLSYYSKRGRYRVSAYILLPMSQSMRYYVTYQIIKSIGYDPG